MKATTIFVIVLLVAAVSLQAQVSKNYQLSQEKCDRAIANYVKALESSNLGMVESAITNIMIMKYYYPEHDYSTLVEELDDLADDNPSDDIRFIAILVKKYLQEPQKYQWMAEKCVENNTPLSYIFTNNFQAQI